jgi:hypothetical protein
MVPASIKSFLKVEKFGLGNKKRFFGGLYWKISEHDEAVSSCGDILTISETGISIIEF